MTTAGTTPTHRLDDDVRFGLASGVVAYTLWGVFPVYFKLVHDVAPFEVLTHRILWAVPFGAVIIALRKQWREVFSAFTSARLVGLLAISAVAIAANWFIYIWAVVHDRILEASLGYYINPLMYVAAGVFILGERLRRAQIAAVILAGLGVSVLTIGSGAFPWAAVGLAFLFTVYGYVRKTAPVGAMPGLFVETVLLAPIAAVYLAWLAETGASVFLHQSVGKDALLVFAGPMTVVPLVMFALAARRLKLSTLGFLQYIGPTLQFAMGLAYGETFTVYHAICFGLIWTALGVFSIDAARAGRRRPKVTKAA